MSAEFDTLLRMLNTPLGKFLQDTYDALEILHKRTTEADIKLQALRDTAVHHNDRIAHAMDSIAQLQKRPETQFQKLIKESNDGTPGLPTRSGKRGKKLGSKRKKARISTGGNGRRKKPDDSGDSKTPTRKKRGRPPLNRMPSK